jgi:RHS repeat-associated protein
MKQLLILCLIIVAVSLASFAYAYETQTAGNIPLNDGITAIAVNPSAGIAAGVSKTTRALYIIDTSINSVIKRIPLGITPVAIAFDGTGNHAVVSTSEGILQFIDPETENITKTLTLPGKVGAVSVHISSIPNIIYIATGNNLIMLDASTGQIIKQISFSDSITGIAFDQTLNYLLLTSESRNVLSVYNAQTLEAVTVIKTANIPAGIAINPSTHIALLTNTDGMSISIVSLDKMTLLDTIPFHEKPLSVAIDADANIALIGHKSGIAIIRLENPVSVIDRLIPESSTAGDPGFSLSIEGSKFVRESKASFNLRELETTFESNNNLRALVPSDELFSPGDFPVSITNPSPGGGISNSLIFKIFNPMPKLEAISPETVALTAPSVTVRVMGKNFLPNSVINFNGQNMKTRFISSILLEVGIDLSGVVTPSQYPVTVINPTPVSFTSNPVFLTVVPEDEYNSKALKEEAKKEVSDKTTGSLTGRILNTQKQPIEGVKVAIKNISAETDANGNFTLNSVPSGRQHLMIHGSTVKEKDSHYPTIPLTVNIEADKINPMPFQIYLHQQKSRNFRHIDPNEDTILTDAEVPGFELRIPKGVNITGWDGKRNLKISVRTVPTDRLPVKPLPNNAFVRTVYMFYFDKIGGGIPNQPIPIKSPNDLGLLPKEKAVLWYYDESPNEGEAPNDWAIAGTGTVTPDGMYIVSDPGVGIPKFCCGASAWGGTGTSGPPSGNDGSCNHGCCGSAGGGNGGGGGGGGGFSGPGPSGPSGTAGDPVDLATGFFIYSKTDFYLPGVIPVSISRYYRSGDTNFSTFGRGAYFEYDWWLGDYGDMLLLVKPGNYQYRFPKQTDGTYINTTDPLFSGAVVTHNATDDTRTLSMKDGTKYKFIYKDRYSGELIEIEDRNSNKLTLTRMPRSATGDDQGGYLTKITTPEGRTVTFNLTYSGQTPSGFFRTDEIIDSTGKSVKYYYELDPLSYYQRLKKVIYPDKSTLEYQYDSQSRMSGIINERGILEVVNEYYPDNPNNPYQKYRIYRQTHADGGKYTFNYVVAGGYVTETSMTAPNGAVTTWRFNSDRYISEKTGPDGTTTYNRGPGTNRILSVTDPAGRSTSYTYDDKGRVTALTDNAGNTTTYQYENTFSMVTGMTNALGQTTNMTYDSKGNVATMTTPDNQTTSYTYNSIGKPLTVTDALGYVTTMAYDTAGNLTSVEDPLGYTSTMAYDSLGRLNTMTDAKGKSTDYTHDAMGRITEVEDPLGGITRYGYDLKGNLIMVADAKNQVIRYEYDQRDRLKKMTDQLGRIETYSYNTSDNLVSVTDRKGQTTIYTYDLMNRMTRADYADGSYTAYTYDSAGRLTTINDSISGTISYTYSGTGCGSGCSSAADKVVQEVTPFGTIDYTYDAIGRRTSMTVSGQPTLTYGYDANSRLTNVIASGAWQSLSFALDYDEVGRRTSVSLPNGVTTNYSYDNASRLLNVGHLNPAQQVLESLTYTYDANGNRISMNRPSVALPLPNQVSNTSYNDANHMLSFNDKNIIYDENGNMTSVTNACGTTNYTWDARNRLVGIQGFDALCSPLPASFNYDALGRRIEKTINGRTLQYVYDGLDIVQEIENGLPSVNYIRTLNIDEPLARIKADGMVRYYQTDALGSVIASTDDIGVVKTTYVYDPFGNVMISGEASDNPFQYTGRENDNTGLYYYRARYYSTELQRFISEDPIGFDSWDVNFYVMVGNNPIKFTDPIGLLPRNRGDCNRYLSCCKKNGDYCCLAYYACRFFEDGECSKCMRGCLLDEKKCGTWKKAVPDHSYCAGFCFYECRDQLLKYLNHFSWNY